VKKHVRIGYQWIVMAWEGTGSSNHAGYKFIESML